MDPVVTSQDEDLPTSTQDISSSSLADPATSDQTSLLDQTLTSSTDPCPKKSEALPTTSNTTPESLSTPSAALLIFAECVGTGILALPYFCFVLPRGFGIFYLLLNYLVNVYCASLLCTAASLTEARLNLPHPVRDLVALADKVHSGNMPLPLSPLPSSSASPPPPSSLLPRLCRFFFCTNLFLLLGTYLLTMAKGLATSFSSPPSIVFNVICIFSLMALTASLSKMSQLGRSPTYISIACVRSSEASAKEGGGWRALPLAFCARERKRRRSLEGAARAKEGGRWRALPPAFCARFARADPNP
jgi:hypothetical protein